MTQPPEPTPREGGSGSGLTGKIGPLPAWAWLGIAVVGGVVAILWLRNRNAAAASGSSTTDTGTTGVSPDVASVANLQDQLATVESQIRDIQGGTSTPPAPGTDTVPTTTAVITEGQGLNTFLAKYHITLDQLLQYNPDVQQYLKTTNAGGYGPGGPDSLAFNVGTGPPLIVRIPLINNTPVTPTTVGTTTPSVNGVHAVTT